MLLLRLVSRAFYTDLIDFGVNAELSYRGPALLDERIRFLQMMSSELSNVCVKRPQILRACENWTESILTGRSGKNTHSCDWYSVSTHQIP